LFIPDPVPDFFTHPGSRGQKGTGSRIQIQNTVIRGDAVYRTVILSYNVAAGQDSPFPLTAGMKLNTFKCEKNLIYALFHLHDHPKAGRLGPKIVLTAIYLKVLGEEA
jgi:hypothetical protein